MNLSSWHCSDQKHIHKAKYIWCAIIRRMKVIRDMDGDFYSLHLRSGPSVFFHGALQTCIARHLCWGSMHCKSPAGPLYYLAKAGLYELAGMCMLLVGAITALSQYTGKYNKRVKIPYGRVCLVYLFMKSLWLCSAHRFQYCSKGWMICRQ